MSESFSSRLEQVLTMTGLRVSELGLDQAGRREIMNQAYQIMYALYKEAKLQYQNSIVLIRSAGFYDTFDDDAQACMDQFGDIPYVVDINGQKISVVSIADFNVEYCMSCFREKGGSVVMLANECGPVQLKLF